MRQMIIILLCFTFVLVGCSSKDNPQTKDTEPNDVPNKIAGVYYPGIDEKVIGQKYNPLASYLYSLLHYNGNMYTTSYEFTSENKLDTDIDAIVGDEITSVYGNHGLCWSTDSNELLENTLEGILYKVKGYDEDFRVCLYFEKVMPSQDTFYYLYIFDKLNNISLYKGEELYKERLHLDESTSVYYNSDNGEAVGFNADTWSQLSINDDILKEFMTILFKGEFIDNKSESSPKLDLMEGYPMVFIDSAGLPTEIAIYKDGYISMENSEKTIFLLKMDTEICLKMIERIQSLP